MGTPAIKPHERDGHNIRVPKSRSDVTASGLPVLDRDATYIWIIDQNGSLIIAVEENLQGAARIGAENALGHPTLVDGQAARMAGESKYDTDGWYIDGKSGRYGTPHRPNARQLLANCANLANWA
ncbi:MAG: hypothetical protein Tsb0016_20900 [Sphingomonadales bacterium]